MAPSQHLRLTLVTLVLGASLALSGCGSQQPGAAAIVNGTPISEKSVQTVSLELAAIAPSQQKVTPGIVLLNLILAPYVLAEADHAGKGVPVAEARKAVAKVASPSPATIDFVRMQLAIPSLSEASKKAILTTVSKAKITVNPRYGSFDPRQGLVRTSPNWIKPTTSPVAK